MEIDLDKERKLFENQDFGLRTPLNFVRKMIGYEISPFYAVEKTQAAWEAWQARALLDASKDYKDVLAGHRRLIRDLDVLFNGEEGAAQQASLGDIVAQIRKEGIKIASTKSSKKLKGDMFWNADDPERFGGESLHDAVLYAADNFCANDLPIELVFNSAKRLKDLRVRITRLVDEEWQYEIVKT